MGKMWFGEFDPALWLVERKQLESEKTKNTTKNCEKFEFDLERWRKRKCEKNRLREKIWIKRKNGQLREKEKWRKKTAENGKRERAQKTERFWRWFPSRRFKSRSSTETAAGWRNKDRVRRKVPSNGADQVPRTKIQTAVRNGKSGIWGNKLFVENRLVRKFVPSKTQLINLAWSNFDKGISK